MPKIAILKSNFGQSLFEVVVAVGISALILTAVVSLAAGAVRNSSFSRNNAQATKYAQEAMEWLREQRDLDWTVFASYATGLPICLGSSPPSWGGSCNISTDPKFSRSVRMDQTNSEPTPTTILTVVEVTWADAQGTHTVRSSTVFTDWKQ